MLPLSGFDCRIAPSMSKVSGQQQFYHDEEGENGINKL